MDFIWPKVLRNSCTVLYLFLLYLYKYAAIARLQEEMLVLTVRKERVAGDMEAVSLLMLCIIGANT